jgi:hypothetical protein
MGGLADVRVYNTALDPCTIAAIAANQP